MALGDSHAASGSAVTPTHAPTAGVDTRHSSGSRQHFALSSAVCVSSCLPVRLSPAGRAPDRSMLPGQTRNPGHCRARTPHTRGATIAPPPATAFPLVCDEEVAKASMRFSHQRSV